MIGVVGWPPVVPDPGAAVELTAAAVDPEEDPPELWEQAAKAPHSRTSRVKRTLDRGMICPSFSG